VLARIFTGGVVRDDVSPETYTWSLTFQREVLKDWSVELRYVGTKGLYLPLQVRYNAGIPIGGRLPVFMSQAQAAATNFTGTPTLASLQAQQIGLLDPYGFGGTVTAFNPDGRSSYHGGSVRVERRFTQGFMLNSNYTWSKTIDLGENELFTSFLNPRRPVDFYNFNQNRGLSGIHRAHKFVVSAIYDIPGYQGDSGALKALLGGWQVSGSYLAESGQHVSIISRRDVNGDFDTAGDNVFFNPAGTPNVGSDSQTVCWNGVVVSFNCTAATQTVGYYSLNPNAQYVRGRSLMFTNLGRNTFRSAGINNWNLQLQKSTPWGEEGREILFTVQFINAFNHPSPIIGVGSVFGFTDAATTNTAYITPGATGFLDEKTFSGGLGNAPFQRIIQFGLKFIF